MDGKAVSVDFESLKKDLFQFGNSLRTTFEEAKQEIQKTKQFKQHRRRQRKHSGETAQSVVETAATATTEATGAVLSALQPTIQQIKISSRKMPTPRKYSLQQGLLSIFGGSASSAALYYLLNTAGQSGLLQSLEAFILSKSQLPLTGLAPVFQALWVLGLISVAKGFAHLFNGIFFAPKPKDFAGAAITIAPDTAQAQPQFIPVYLQNDSIPAAATTPPSVVSPDTDELRRETDFDRLHSVTEDPTARFTPREAERSGSGS
jgi:hypothetical protein